LNSRGVLQEGTKQTAAESFCKFPVKTKAAGLLHARRQDFEAVRAG
jgi:hypothetical protein